jgi:predicted enzyme related to lactoylglutathione lyase
LAVSITSVSAVVTVADFKGGLAWYERFFGRPADQRPMDGLAEWHHTESGAVQVVHDAERGGRALLTLGVGDLDGFLAELSSRGLTVGDVIAGVIARIASITDPEGNVITCAQLYPRD